MYNNGRVIEENVKLICKQKFFVRSEMRSKTQRCWNVPRNNLRRSIVPTTSHSILQVTVSSSKSSTFNYCSHAFIWSNIEVDVLFSLVIGSLSSTSISVISVRDMAIPNVSKSFSFFQIILVQMEDGQLHLFPRTIPELIQLVQHYLLVCWWYYSTADVKTRFWKFQF